MHLHMAVSVPLRGAGEMTQGDLFEIYRWRATDPHTSKEAGENADDFAGKHYTAIIRTLRETGRPMASEEIADYVNFGGFTVPNWPTRRLCELERRGLVVPTEELHVNRTGRRARKYRLVGE